jgi:hypothetical protein
LIPIDLTNNNRVEPWPSFGLWFYTHPTLIISNTYLWGVLKNGMFVLACVLFFKTPCIFGVFFGDPNTW